MIGRQRRFEYNDADRAAVDRLDREFRRSLLSYFGRRTRNGADLEDMVQAVFERLIKRGGTSELERQNLSAYVFETASSVLADHLRQRLSRRSDVHEPFDQNQHGGTDFSPEHVLIDRQELARATAALLELPERTRVIFVLRRLEGMRLGDIASRLGLSVSAVEKHIQRAVLHLMRRVDPE
ncbi:RNA polymerase sigma factor [Sphingopyxis sp. YF1]|uniref:RNA polymerase sigma factor n=1 Tax=Sphingopyxis sp. YF1 TaxID=2482763 RepID=UPI001F60FEA9|nr:RNA polymerase sigma factor [Sphingopyxis sp. YF1]UNU42761.1 RNA polymerase sigma factor [Sphingopyxis sp. YF1]